MCHTMSRVTLQVHTELKNRDVWLRIMLFLLYAVRWTMQSRQTSLHSRHVDDALKSQVTLRARGVTGLSIVHIRVHRLTVSRDM